MVNLYVKQIKDHIINKATQLPWTIDDVPEHWREKVRKELEKD